MSAPLRTAITAALEALGAGDTRYATMILLAALDDGQTVRTHPCPLCGVGFEWPGLLEHHLRASHFLSADEIAGAA